MGCYMRLLRLVGLICLVTACSVVSAFGAGVSVRAVVDRQEVVLGEGFSLEIQVEGSESPKEPDLSAITDFTVVSRGGQQNSSESVSIINGHLERISRRGYVFNYQLTPKREGRLVIPPLTVVVGKQSYQTQALPILVNKPQESEDFKLRLDLNKEQAYVGEPIVLTVTWYIGKDVKGFNFNLPVLNDPRFAVSDGPGPALDPKRDEVVRIPAPGGDILAEKARGVLNGNNYLTVSFSKTLTVKAPGRLTLPQATVSCQALSGYTQGRGQDPFSGSFPNDFFGGPRRVYRTVVAPSNQPTLTVLPLPSQGRPADFTGLVGAYSLAVTATPTQVKVGDPITLSVQVAGPAVAGVKLPDLGRELGTGFKVPDEMAPGEGSGVLKTFTQTIRANNAGVKEIPSLHLSYFNPASSRYEIASSQPVPLKVSEAKTVTLQDAYGASAGAPDKRTLKTAAGGINFNYEGPELLEHQEPVDSLGLGWGAEAALIAPPSLWAVLGLALLAVRRRNRDSASRRARQAGRMLKAELNRIGEGAGGEGYLALGRAMRDYLGAKLNRNPAALTYADAEPGLVALGAGPECLARLRQVMEGCEAAKYAGSGLDGADLGRLVELARRVASDLG